MTTMTCAPLFFRSLLSGTSSTSRTMPEDTYDEVLEFAYALAEDVSWHCARHLTLQAGKLILEGAAKRWRAHQEYEVKKNPVDVHHWSKQ